MGQSVSDTLYHAVTSQSICEFRVGPLGQRLASSSSGHREVCREAHIGSLEPKSQLAIVLDSAVIGAIGLNIRETRDVAERG